MTKRFTVYMRDDEGERVLIEGAQSALDAAQRAGACDPEIDVATLAGTWNATNASESVRYTIGEDES